ncbi:glycoside hydrolase family 2 TIM barrel-domain containing protein [Rubellicoccus peritrichatus]|uniref:Glycoside hydrolase family 2 TIM barrel-domain containing protein n=1 Tax=Rubellicoccus peritrichatus TaxID=3080537 RepID=A0AAQ3QVI0_9BACT|nr:glycoside hydrolase family 2 TIM barrel-domain containing protein [Puniceicoccus sp. CR14]WOO43441.1 glycoside hydrolase family 2 TIM barrel-domain containing protein [Puniceicoccus sp. CR14]
MYTNNRIHVDLNGTWKFNPDPYMRCKQQSWWKETGTNHSFFPCWDPDGLWDIQVPGTWKTQFEELKWYDGDANYMLDFEVADLPDDQEAFLCFDGVIYKSDIYLNGQQIATHDWGYSPFQVRVTGTLREKNRLFVLVENKLSKDRVPGIRFDWNNDGGIVGGVKLVFVPKAYVENFRVETKIGDGEVAITCHANLQCRDNTVCEDIRFEIPELGVSELIEQAPVGETVSRTVRLPREKIRLWCPDDPKLYETQVSTRHETLTDEIGYREIKTQGHEVILNGEPVVLYGVCVHSEFPETGRTPTAKGIETMIAQIKELGCNFVRCAHYPYAEEWGRAMDKAGLLWWEEVPVYWLSNIHQPHMSRLALGMMEETIRRDWNRASLIIWSVSNECAGSDSDGTGLGYGNYPYWFEAVKMIREMDPSRLISSADSGHRKTLNAEWTPDAGDAFDHNYYADQWIPGHPDEFYDLLDILAGNVYCSNPGEGTVAYHKYVDMLKDYNKPLMISEFGSMSLLGASDPTIEKLGTEERHEVILREAYTSFRELPEIVGYMPWCLMDVRVPMHWRWYNAGKAVFRYGLMDEKGNKKRAFTVVAEENANLREARLDIEAVNSV